MTAHLRPPRSKPASSLTKVVATSRHRAATRACRCSTSARQSSASVRAGPLAAAMAAAAAALEGLRARSQKATASDCVR